MNPTLQAFVDSEIATVVRVVPVPTGVLGFGSDLECLTDITPTARPTSDPATLLGQWCVHALYTTKGMLPGDSAEEKSFGLNLLDMIGQDAGPNNARQWELAIQQELQKNEQIASALAEVTVPGSLGAQEFSVALTITPADPTLAPFDLVLAVTPLGVFLDTVEGPSS